MNKLFVKNHPAQLGFFKSLQLEKSKLFLRRLNNEHIRKNKRQIAVFAFDSIALEVALYGVYEKKELELFFDWLSFIQKDFLQGVAIDIGANIGNHSLFFSDYFKKIYSFEPNKNTFKLLSFNANLVNNIECFNYGLSDKDSSSTMVFDKKNIGGAKLASDLSSDAVVVNLKTLDSSNSFEERVYLLKIDVEGHELEVLKGAEKTIAAHQPIIIFEQLSAEFNHGSSNCIELLKKYGYQDFAYLKFSPEICKSIPKFLRRRVKLLHSKFLGETGEVIKSSTFETRNYPFLIAIPKWLNESL
ncbi:MAG: FkbM family methyltransferase [Methylotenera sp.]|nr:FkbM family methyltransferase [Methylotenera sp.]